MNDITIQALGQSGFLLSSKTGRFLFDPYLSNIVAEKYGADFERLIPTPLKPEMIKNIDAIFITHIHDDHCDVKTLSGLLKTNPHLKIYAPEICLPTLLEAGFSKDQIAVAVESEAEVKKDVKVRSVPAAHLQIERSNAGSLNCVGYILEIDGVVFYHSGDTMPHDEISQALPKSIDLAFLPINERNFFRDKRGIIGNLTLREALTWVEELGIKKWIPMHWDMFKLNSVFPEELNFLAKKMDVENKIQWLTCGQVMALEVKNR
ncbi:MAG: ulaG [Bacteriovoracaceae bacterium]|nr:ulaG [Bacteriovoracaceae bacterium]